MKAIRTGTVLMAALLSTSLLPAQMEDRPILSVSVPFAFTVENTRMPAGEYIVSVIYRDHLWKLSTVDHKANVLLRVSPDFGNGTLPDTQLIFLHYPTDYVLSQISDRDMDVIATVYAGKRARQLASFSTSELVMIKGKAF